MTGVVQFGGGALAALIAVLITVVILAVIVMRIARADARVRIARLGVFVERQRVDELPELPELEPLDEQDTSEWPRRRDPLV